MGAALCITLCIVRTDVLQYVLSTKRYSIRRISITIIYILILLYWDYAVGGEEVLASLNGILEWENKEKVKVFELDLFDYHSIVDALKGCCGLFYSFQPPLDHSTYDV